MTEGLDTATPVNVRSAGNPGRDVQRVGTAAFLGEDPTKIHDPVWAVLGNLGDSQCYPKWPPSRPPCHDASPLTGGPIG